MTDGAHGAAERQAPEDLQLEGLKLPARGRGGRGAIGALNVELERRWNAGPGLLGWSRFARFVFLLWIALPAQAGTVLGPWTPIFKGVDYAVGTNTAGGGGFPNRQVIHAIRVDLNDPDVELLASPRIANYVANVRETAGYQVKDFLTVNRLQVAINAGFFDPTQYYLAAGTPMRADGLLVSRGTVVSTQDSAAYAATIAFSEDNLGTVIHTNWPPVSTTGIYTAVSGDYPLVVDGVNIGYRYLGQPGVVHEVHPRTAFGLSRDRRTLYLLAIDGRQPGYSTGALDWETGAWLLLLGAHDGINLDGGGSTTLVMADSTGNPIELNRPSAVADSGRERTVGSHFGLYAKPVPAFMTDVAANPDDTAAVITWTTVEAATSRVEYGLTPELGSSTALDARLTTDHAALLTGLTPNTAYYFVLESSTPNVVERSALLTFTTTNYFVTNQVLEITSSWKHTAANLDGVAWTAHAYLDSDWDGPGPGLLWIDTRSTGPLPEVQPKGAELPADVANSGFPFITYYFRTRFTLADATASALIFSAYLDDGAVLYLNGRELHRLGMDPLPTPILNATLAAGYYCEDGNATCPLDFVLVGDALTNLVAGENVLAVEVHNYNPRSPDITFGTSLAIAQSHPPAPLLTVTLVGGIPTLSWDRIGLILQQAEDPAGPWADVPGPVFLSPCALTDSKAVQYFRLRR